MSVAEAPSGRILVTGATGNVGRPLLARLKALGGETVAATTGEAAGANEVSFDFTDQSTWPAALDGVDRVFLLRPPPLSDVKRYIRPFIAAMGERGVRHVVFLSLLGVNRVMPHWQIEQDLRSSSMGWTFLRPAFFMQNLTGPYRDDIRDRDVITQPAGRGAFSFIDSADIAAAAALVLERPLAHRDSVLTLTGSEAIGYREVAAMLSVVLGRAIRYEPSALLTARRTLLDAGSDSTYANVQLVINVTARLGMAKKITPDLERLLGRPAVMLRDFLQANRSAWQRPVA